MPLRAVMVVPLNETLFASLAHARAALAEWRLDCNTVRPYSSLGNPLRCRDTELGIIDRRQA